MPYVMETEGGVMGEARYRPEDRWIQFPAVYFNPREHYRGDLWIDPTIFDSFRLPANWTIGVEPWQQPS